MSNTLNRRNWIGHGLAAAATLALGLPGRSAHAQQFINVLTGGTSGVYYPLGVALSKLFGDGIKDSRAQVQATKASVENLNLLQQGRGEIGFALGDSVKYAWDGDAELGFPRKLDRLRAVAAIYPNVIQVVAAASSGIETFEQLKGKSLSVGAAKSGTEVNARRILEAMGMSYGDLSKTEYLPFGESVELIKNRQLDATLQSAGLGVASLRDLAASLPVNIVAVPSTVATKLGPPYQASTIPAGTYEGQRKDVPTVAVMNFLVTHEGVPEQTVYDMTKLTFEHLNDLVSAHKAASAISLDTATKGLPIPLHPGAARYFREKGMGV